MESGVVSRLQKDNKWLADELECQKTRASRSELKLSELVQKFSGSQSLQMRLQNAMSQISRLEAQLKEAHDDKSTSRMDTAAQVRDLESQLARSKQGFLSEQQKSAHFEQQVHDLEQQLRDAQRDDQNCLHQTQLEHATAQIAEPSGQQQLAASLEKQLRDTLTLEANLEACTK